MHTFANSLRDSMFSVLGMERWPHSPAAVDAIRQAMLRELGPDGPIDRSRLRRRICGTQDATGLWLVRADLYAHLCHIHSEPVAMERMQALQPLFVGRVPAGWMGGRRPGGPRLRARSHDVAAQT